MDVNVEDEDDNDDDSVEMLGAVIVCVTQVTLLFVTDTRAASAWLTGAVKNFC